MKKIVALAVLATAFMMMAPTCSAGAYGYQAIAPWHFSGYYLDLDGNGLDAGDELLFQRWHDFLIIPPAAGAIVQHSNNLMKGQEIVLVTSTTIYYTKANPTTYNHVSVGGGYIYFDYTEVWTGTCFNYGAPFCLIVFNQPQGGWSPELPHP